MSPSAIHVRSLADFTASDPSPTQLAQGVYAAQMLAAPQWANDFYFKEGHKSSKNWQNWFVLPSSRPLSRTAS